jgi:hypothetical protein
VVHRPDAAPRAQRHLLRSTGATASAPLRAWRARPPFGLTRPVRPQTHSESAQICFGGSGHAWFGPRVVPLLPSHSRAGRLSVSYTGRAWKQGPLLLLGAAERRAFEGAVEVLLLAQDVVDDPGDLFGHQCACYRLVDDPSIGLLALLAAVPVSDLPPAEGGSAVVLDGTDGGVAEGELEVGPDRPRSGLPSRLCLCRTRSPELSAPGTRRQ